MRKWLGMAVAGLVALACVGTAQAKHYALCTGLNQYKSSYVSSDSWLNGCVPDAKNVYTNITLRGEWTTSDATQFLNSAGTFAAVSNKLMEFASAAVSGDVVLYYHSSHGYQDSGKNTGICMYDKDMPDSSFAKILANFKSGVKVIIVLDTCHSGGMFKSLRRDGSTRDLDTGSPFTFAERVNEELAAIRADEAARGIKAAKLAVLDCAWVTAADYNQYSWDGDEGGAFTECYVGSVKSGACDKSPYGNGDSYATFKEMFDYAVAQDDTHGDGKPGSEDYTMPQCTNTTILAAVRFGWVGKEAPTGVRFDPIPEQTATAGEEMTYTLTASNSDGSSGKITFSVASSTAPEGSYSLDSSSGAFSFTPPTDGTFSFSFLGTNATAHTDGKANMTVTASLAAPAKLSNSGITVSSFTANWGAVAGASSYVLEVFADDSGASATAKGSDDAFRLVTSADELTEGEYVILADGADVAMNNTCSGSSSGYLSCTDVTVEDSAVSTDDASIIWTLAGDAASCTLFNAAAGKFVNPATTKSIGWASDASGAWTLSLANGLVSAENAKDTSWVLQYNAGSPRFMCYSSKQKLLRFFRRDGASGAVFSGDVGNVTSFTVTDLIPGDYTWRVRAIGNAKGPFSDVQEVSLVADPTAPPSIRAIADEEILVGEPLYIPVKVSAPEEAPVTSLEITAGDAAAKLGEDGIFSFIPEAPGTYDFTITAVNANGSASEDFTVTATLPEPVTPEVPAVVDSDGFTAVWSPVAGAESYELVVIEGKGGSSGGGGGGGSGETLTETFANAEFSPGGGSYGSQTISGCDLGTWTATESRGDKGTPVFRAGGTLTSPSIAGGVASVEFDYVWPFSESGACDIDLYVGGTKVDSASVTGGTPGTASYASFAAVSGATSIEFRNTGSSNKRIQVNQVRIGTASKSIARAVGDVVYSNNVGNVTSFDVTGLQPNTEYTFAFRAIAGGEATDWSEPVSVTTADGPSAPAWSAIPAQNTYVGATFQLDLTPYLAGSPLPTVTADVGTVTGLHYVYAPEATGSVTVTLTASNDSGSDQTTFVLAVAEAPVGGNHYAVVVGCNKYDTEYVDSNNWLNGCVPDANHVHSLITTRGEWDAANVTKLTDSAAKHDAIRAAIASAASKAVAGDTFLYFHSSHGGNYTYTFVTNTALYTDWPIMVYDVDPEGIDNCICSYNADYPAAELAADLAAFDPAVNIVVMIDACHSAGMYKYDTAPTSGRVVRRNAAGAAMRSAHPAVFADAVEEQLGAIRRARGIRAAAANVGFVTAADFDEYSFDSQSGDGGEFTSAFIEGVTNGLCDGAEYGDQDGYASFYEGWNYAKDIAVGIPVGTVVDDDGHKVDANGYALYDNSYYAEYYDEPQYYYDYYFTHAQITNEAVLRAVRVGYAGNPTLAAPVANPATDVTASSFTASWSAVADATAYRLQVATDPSFSGGAASDTLTADDFTATSTSYTEFSGVAKDSGAVYAGKSARNTDGAIQLNNSTTTQAGIWTTASGGNASRVSVEWSDATTTSKPRSVQVYGSSTALASYADVKSATLLGSITYGSSSALDITDSCAYVGILANGGALYLDSVTIDWGAAGSESSIVLDENVGTDTSVEVSGLEAETDYYYRVQALGGPVDSDFSNVISLTTESGTPYAPVWSEIPEQSAVAGQMFSIDLTAFVSGSPAPVITVNGEEVPGGIFRFEPESEGTQTFALVASNDLGSDNATLTVAVAGAPVYVPTLVLSNPSSEGFDASWTACTGVSTYTLQIATDDQFSTGGSGGEVDFFANAGTSATAPADWTYDITSAGNRSGLVIESGNYVISEAFNASACVDLSLALSIRTYGGTEGTSDTLLVEYTADGTTWNELGSITASGNSLAGKTLDISAAAGNAAVRLRFTAPGATASKGVGIANIAVSGHESAGTGSLVKELEVTGTSTTVDGLEPETTYYARVKGAVDWSAVESITTSGIGPVPEEIIIDSDTVPDIAFGDGLLSGTLNDDLAAQFSDVKAEVGVFADGDWQWDETLLDNEATPPAIRFSYPEDKPGAILRLHFIP